MPKGATFKAVVAGRPQSMGAKKDYVVLTFLAARLPSLPKGLPTPPPPGKIVVYVAVRQFDKIADQLAAHPEDVIVVEGYTAQEGGQPVVFATNCTTKLLQQAKKEQQIAAAAAAAKPSE